jgi:hypothetical protein
MAEFDPKKSASANYLAGLQAAALPTQAPGDAGKFLTTNGSTSSWASVAPGGVTSVDVSGGSTGLT